MHILFLTDNFYPERNAAASRVYERACYWVKWGHEVTIITCAPNFPEGQLFSGYKNKMYRVECKEGIRIVRVKTFIAANKGFFLRILDQLSFTLPAFIAGLFQKKFDLVVATTPTPFAAIAAWGISVFRRCPFVLEVSDIWPASITGVGAMRQSVLIQLLEKMELFLYRRATSLIFLSHAFVENVTSRGISKEKMHVVLNGVDLSRYTKRPRNETLASEYALQPENFIVGYVGTHGMAHALENVVHTANLMKDHPHIRFVFVGAGAARDTLITLAQSMNLKNIFFIPAQAKEKIAEFWSLCHVALVHLKNAPVFSEVIPSKIFEAMGMGLPILIAAPQGEAVSLIEKNQIGLSVTPENPDALAKQIQYYYDHPNVMKEHGDNGHRLAPSYSRERQAQLFLDVLEQTLSIK